MMQLSGFQSDALREIGSIGMGNATTALSQLLNCKVQLNLSNSEVIDIASMPSMMPSSITLAAIIMELTGDLNGIMMVLFDSSSAVTLSSLLVSKNTQEEDPEMYESALNEMGNILAGSYLKNIYDLLGVNVLQSTPEIMIGDAQKLFTEIAARLSGGSTDILNIETMFQVQGLSDPQGNSTLYGDMFVFLDKDSLSSLFMLIEKLLNGQ